MNEQTQLELLGENNETPSTVHRRIVDDFPTDSDIPNGTVFVIRNYESRYLTHTFHKYAGKFIPNVPRWAMRAHLGEERRVILDPFVGSGTTMVEALLEGHESYGMDIDPLARLIAKTKTTLLSESCLKELPRSIETKVAQCAEGSHIPGTANLSHWFTPRAVDELSRIREVVFEHRSTPDVFDFLLMCFSSIIRRVSNADNQTMKTYVSHTNPKVPEKAVPLFLATVYRYSNRLLALKHSARPGGSARTLSTGDARDVSSVWIQERLPEVDLAITSPPYIKSVDYIYNQMAELFWVGDLWNLETQSKQNHFKKKYIGNDRVLKKQAAEPDYDDLPEANKYISQVRQNNPKLAVVMQRYFRDMHQHFRNMRSLMRPGAKYVMVVGNSTLAGVPVPTQSLISSLGARNGFAPVSCFGYEIRNKHMRFPRSGRGGTVDLDWVISFENGG